MLGSELTSKYTSEHPRLTSIHQQIADARRALAEQSPDRTQTTHAANPIWEQLSVSLALEESEAASHASRAEALDLQRADLQRQISAFNADEMEIHRLQQEVNLLSDSRQSYAAKLEQARLDDALQTREISNVAVAQPPTFVERPVSPRKLGTLAGGLLVAICGGVGAMTIADAMQRSMPAFRASTRSARGEYPAAAEVGNGHSRALESQVV
jgi:uncharacterized protein involved in exopolysaccharide biosynthesis